MVRLALINQGVVAHAAAIGRWSHSNDAAEHRAEVALIAEAYLLADTGHGFFGSGKESLRALDPEMIEGRHERETGDALEKAHEMRFAHAANARRLADLYGVAAVFSQVPEPRPQAFDVLVLP